MNILDKYQSYIKNLSVYFGASLIPMVVSILTNPIFAYFLSPVDYAIIGYYTSFNTLLTPFILFYMLHYYQRMFFKVDGEQREELKRLLLSSLFYFSLILLVVSIIGLYVYVTYISPNSEMPFFPYGILALLPCWFTNFYTLTSIDLKMERKSNAYFRLSLWNLIFTTGFSLLLVAGWQLGALGKMIGMLIGPIIMFAYLFRKQKKYICVPFRLSHFKEMIVFCGPLVVAAMLGFFSNGYDRVYLERIVSVETLGYYSVGVSIAMYLSVFSKAVGDTFSPDIFQSIVHCQYRRCVKFILIQVAVITLIVGLFLLLSPYVVYLLTAGRYVSSVPYAQIVALSSITSCLYYAFSQLIIAKGYTKITMLNKIIGSVCCVLMYSVFIIRWGAIGAAWAIVCSHLIFLLGAMLLVGLYKSKVILSYVRK